MILGILAAAIFPAMTGYLETSRDAARTSYIRDASTLLSLYYSDYLDYPKMPDSGCLSADMFPKEYIYGNQKFNDPVATNIMPGCDGSDGTFAYRLIKGDDGREVYVIGAKMEDTKNWNSNLPIDQITADMVLVQWSGMYYYHVGE